VRTLFTLAYPALGERDMLFIEQVRAAHDAEKRELVAPHFTLVFGSTGVDEAAYLRHVEEVAAKSAPVHFICRRAVLAPDAQESTAHVYLIPEQGFRELSLLHGRLCTGPLAPGLNTDIPFIPHITVGSFTDIGAAQALCDELNLNPISIEGKVEAITVAALENRRIHKLALFELGAQQA
jgi:2'-5' RNA ligase